MQLKKKIFFAALIGAMMIMSACIKSNQPIGAGSNFCDTTVVTFSKNILPLLQSYCYACHSDKNSAFSNGISLDGYNNTKGWADAGYLVADVRHDAGFVGMPYGKPKLSACEINTIVAWANQGELP